MQTVTKRNVVDIDTRRTVVMIARARKPSDVAKEPHEQFVRNLLKDKLGWPRREPAPDTIKQVAREVAEVLKARDRELAEVLKARDHELAKLLKETL